MSTRVRNESPVHDIVGIGFGPANLALAIAVEEHNATSPDEDKVSAIFLERQPTFSWHRGMLIDGAVMQVSFLKDLATMRNPTSDFGFVRTCTARAASPTSSTTRSCSPPARSSTTTSRGRRPA